MDSDKTTTNSRGGKQSELNANYCLLDARAMYSLACVLNRGSKYGLDNWRKICKEEHVDHAINHLFKYIEMLRHDRGQVNETRDSEDDLAHALCRIMFALAKEIEHNGIHPEHADPKYRISDPSPYERHDLQPSGPGKPVVPSPTGVDKDERNSTADSNTPRWDNPIGAPAVLGRPDIRYGEGTYYPRK